MRPLVGLIPAAGRATRLGLQGRSKEVLPVAAADGGERPVIGALLDAMGRAGIERAYVVLREGKWDVPEVLASRDRPGWPEIAYVVTRGTPSIPASLDLAHAFVRDADVALGFGDVRFSPDRALADLVAAHRRSANDVDLALFPSDRPDKTDMVETDGELVSGFRIKPGPCELAYTWILATWGPGFTRFLRRHLEQGAGEPRPRELQISEVLAAALDHGFTIGAHIVGEGRFIDIGTRDDLERASKEAGN